jgi:hypothetical protein
VENEDEGGLGGPDTLRGSPVPRSYE